MLKAFLQPINDPRLTEKNITVDVLRLDLMHPHLQGNKYYKLKYNLQEAQKQHKTTLLTYGGAFSNHILATSFAGKANGFKTIGIIRGEAILPLNSTLQMAQDNGMRLYYVNRASYQQKNTLAFVEGLKEKFGDGFDDVYVIPEGGSNDLAVKGCAEILANTMFAEFSHVCVCVGTGGTIAGLLAGNRQLQRSQQIIGVSVLKNGGFLRDEITRFLSGTSDLDVDTLEGNFHLALDYHFGGYGKNKPELRAFMDDFSQQHGIPLEFVYTGKLFFAIFDLAGKDYFPLGSRVLIIHTGGLREQSFELLRCSSST